MEEEASAASKKRPRARHQVRSIHWSPYDRVRVVNADPEGLCPACLSAHTSLSIPAIDAFQLQLTPFNSTPTFARMERPLASRGIRRGVRGATTARSSPRAGCASDLAAAGLLLGRRAAAGRGTRDEERRFLDQQLSTRAAIGWMDALIMINILFLTHSRRVDRSIV